MCMCEEGGIFGVSVYGNSLPFGQVKSPGESFKFCLLRACPEGEGTASRMASRVMTVYAACLWPSGAMRELPSTKRIHSVRLREGVIGKSRRGGVSSCRS